MYGAPVTEQLLVDAVEMSSQNSFRIILECKGLDVFKELVVWNMVTVYYGLVNSVFKIQRMAV